MPATVSQTEEDYLKAIFKIVEETDKAASTNAIAASLDTSAASVTDMLKRLSEKELINYEKYKGVTLAPAGNRIATHLIRKHRLWEVFLVEKLNFTWDEVHVLAEQLEHIQSELLVDRLDSFLGEPKFDPHGDPIPDKEGNFTFRRQTPLSELPVGTKAVVVGVLDHSTEFLQYLDQIKINLGTQLQIETIVAYDQSLRLLIDGSSLTISNKVAQHLFVQKQG